MRVVELEAPAFGEALVELREKLPGLGRRLCPRLGQRGRTRQTQVPAVRVAGQTIAVAAFAVLGVAAAQRQQGVAREIRFQHAVHLGRFRTPVIQERIAVFVHGHGAAAQAAVESQRSRGVDHAAVVVPAAGRGFDDKLGFGQRLLAHQVDDAARITHAAEQARRAAHDFDAIVERQVLARVVGVRAQRQRRAAIDLHARDLETAGVEIERVVVGALHRDACRVRHRIADAGEALVVDLLASHHGHGLRHFAEGQVGLGRGAGDAAGIGAGAFGGAVFGAAGGYGDGRQRGGVQVIRLALDHGLAILYNRDQAAAGQQPVQRLLRCQPAGHGRRGLAGDERGVVQEFHRHLAGDFHQGFVQGLAGRIDDHGGLGSQRGRGHCGHGKQGEGQASQQNARARVLAAVAVRPEGHER
ncbi:hypothetical protein D3C71_1103840 [compost metagenome]